MGHPRVHTCNRYIQPVVPKYTYVTHGSPKVTTHAVGTYRLYVVPKVYIGYPWVTQGYDTQVHTARVCI